jgi:hypothetical protein
MVGRNTEGSTRPGAAQRTRTAVAFLPAALAGAGLVLGTEHGRLGYLVIVGVLGTAILALAPFRYTCRILVLVTVVTYFSVPILGLHLRPDMAIVPGTFLSAVRSGYGERMAKWATHRVNLALLVFIVVNIGSSLLVSPNIGKSIAICVWFGINLAIVILVLAFYSNRPQRLVADLYNGARVAVLIALATYALNAAGFHVWGVAGGTRARGIALEPNILAGYAVMWAVIVITRNKRLRRTDAVFLAATLVTIAVTSTRAALVALVTGVLVALVFEGIRSSRQTTPLGPRTWGLLMFAVLAFLALLTLAPAFVRPALQEFNRFHVSSQSSDGRFLYWDEALNDLGRNHGIHWLFGLGTNTFGYRHIDPSTIYQPTGPSGGYLSNIVLTVFYDTGIVGFLPLAYVIWYLIFRSGSARVRRRRVAIFVTFLLIAGSTNPFFFAYYWLFIPAALLGEEERRRSSPPGTALTEATLKTETVLCAPRQ